MSSEVEATVDTESEDKPKLKLEVKVDSPSSCQRHVTVIVSKEDVDRYFDDAFTDLMPKASVPGFRAGRAPRKLVESKFREDVSDQVKGSLLMDSMSQITEDEDFSAISEPDFDFEAIELPKDGPLKFEFDLEVRPEFEMPKWKGLKLERPVQEFKKKDVDSHLERLISEKGKLVPHEGAAEDGDYVVLNMSFKHDGNEISSASEQSIRVRPKLSFPDGELTGFDKLMVGAKAGDTKTSKLKISDEAENEELRGKEVEASLEVLEVKRMELPKVDEALLERLGGFENEGELRDAIKEELERRLKYHQQQKVRQQITSLLTESADWDLPPDLVKRQGRRELDRAVMELRSAGFGNDEILAHENQLRRNSLESTKTALKEHFILERLAEDETIEAEPDDYDVEIELIADQRNEPPRRVRARIEKQGMMDALRNQIVERKVIELITSQADFKETKFDPGKDETAAVNHVIGGGSAQAIPEAKHGDDSQQLQQPSDHT